mmetsp:Transcript_36722/g.92022  ORF Transcript_36722/g.92022 Transcript_36722/m.92022 type:complete len:81 (-) Transcript_36722:185-427(-)
MHNYYGHTYHTDPHTHRQTHTIHPHVDACVHSVKSFISPCIPVCMCLCAPRRSLPARSVLSQSVSLCVGWFLSSLHGPNI